MMMYDGSSVLTISRMVQMFGWFSAEAAQFRVFGFIDDTHASSAQLLDDAIARDGLADHEATIRVS
jgi:hypothetical protein